MTNVKLTLMAVIRPLEYVTIPRAHSIAPVCLDSGWMTMGKLAMVSNQKTDSPINETNDGYSHAGNAMLLNVHIMNGAVLTWALFLW